MLLGLLSSIPELAAKDVANLVKPSREGAKRFVDVFREKLLKVLTDYKLSKKNDDLQEMLKKFQDKNALNQFAQTWGTKFYESTAVPPGQTWSGTVASETTAGTPVYLQNISSVKQLGLPSQQAAC